MKAAEFDYYRVSHENECLDLLTQQAAAGHDPKIIAGGQSIVPLMALRMARPDVLIDINSLSHLSYVKRSHPGSIEIGSLVRHSELVCDRHIRRHAPILSRAASHIGHVAIRNRGTIGGSLSHADPAAELPAMAIAMDATISVTSASRGGRELAAADFFVGPYETPLRDDELVTAVAFPIRGVEVGYGFYESANRHGDYARLGAVAAFQFDRERVCGIRAVLFGTGLGGLGINHLTLNRSSAEPPLTADQMSKGQFIEDLLEGHLPDSLAPLRSLARTVVHRAMMSSDAIRERR